MKSRKITMIFFIQTGIHLFQCVPDDNDVFSIRLDKNIPQAHNFYVKMYIVFLKGFLT